MRIDIALEAKIGPVKFRELGQLAEQYGIRAIWAQNYVRAADPFMTAVPMAMASKSIRVGVAVVCPHEMHPLKIANALLTLNEYSQGRGAVVVTSGGEWPGVIKKKSGQLRRTREALEIIDAARGDSALNYDGEVYQCRGYSSAWQSQVSPQLYAGAHGPRMLGMAEEIVDGIMFSDAQPEMFSELLPRLTKKISPDTSTGPHHLSNFVAWHVKEDREASHWEARRELIIRAWLDRAWIKHYLNDEDLDWVAKNTWSFLQAFRDRTGDLGDVPKHISDALVEGLTCSGDMTDIPRHIERLRKFAEAGFTEVVLGLQDEPDEAIRHIGEHVVPALRDAAAARQVD